VLPEPELARLRRELHEALLLQYKKNGTDRPLPGDPYRSDVVFDYRGNWYLYSPAKEEKMDPEGTHILAASKRIGDTDRDKTIEQLRTAGAEGYITLMEMTARIEAASVAEVREDLNRLVRDLETEKAVSVPIRIPVKKQPRKIGFYYLAPLAWTIESTLGVIFANTATLTGKWEYTVAMISALVAVVLTVIAASPWKSS
jgi:hypothetical protein